MNVNRHELGTTKRRFSPEGWDQVFATYGTTGSPGKGPGYDQKWDHLSARRGTGG